MALTPDGKQLYVSVTDGHLSPRNGLGHVDVIRTADDRLVKSIALNGPGLIAMSPDGKTAFVVNSDWVNETNDEMVTPIRTATGTKERAIRVASYKFYPDGIAMSPNGKTLYVLSDKPSPSGSPDPGFLTPIRIATRRVQRAIRVGQGAFDMAMAPDGRSIWVTTGSAGVVPISTASDIAGRAINVGYCAGCGLVVTPDSKTVYVTANNEVWPISAATDTAGQPFLLSGTDGPIYRPGAIAVSPDGKTLYVIAEGLSRRSVVVIQTATNSIVRLVPAGIDALQIIIAPSGKNGYVLDYGR
jgi:DNA-binding beta-propeller fold protein YncE